MITKKGFNIKKAPVRKKKVKLKNGGNKKAQVRKKLLNSYHQL
jgi:hypothetical protein